MEGGVVWGRCTCMTSACLCGNLRTEAIGFHVNESFELVNESFELDKPLDKPRSPVGE